MRNKIIAYTVGVTCHLAFVASIALMAYMIFEGLSKSFFPLGKYGGYVNILLLLQFPLLHSFFLSPRGRRILEMPFPKAIAKDLFTTSFSLFSSLQLLCVFLFWTPTSNPWFIPHGALLYVWSGVYIAAWGLLIVALSEAGMAMHSGSLGWRAVARREKPQYPPLCKTGLHSSCRHPIYLAFALILITAPVWSFDHLMLAVVWVGYCLVGPLFKEQRQIKIFKSDYTGLRQSTPYIIPRLFSVRLRWPFALRR
jgi:protein-S-isoprenylcysteine O-methyltransferase Ste14